MRRAAALAAGLVLAAPPPAGALELGIQDDPAFLGPPITAEGTPAVTVGRALALSRALGARTLRLNVRWAAVTVGPDRYDLSRYEAAVAAARAAGLRVQLALTGPAPAWATADGREGNRAPDPGAFGRFAAAVATTMRGSVTRYAVWNEPNWRGLLAPRERAPALYRALYRSAWRALRRADPHARVLFGELAPMGAPEDATTPLAFLRGATCTNRRWRPVRHCAPLHADGFALHPYTLRWRPDFPGRSADDVTTGSLARIDLALRRLAATRALATRRGRPLPLYLTEWGWHARSFSIPEPLRSRFLVEGLDLIAADPHVRQVVWYQLVGAPDRPRPAWDTGLLDADGSPRPAFAALRGWERARARVASGAE
jgi:polysaccharide biosynthesis protein PslG